MELLFLSTHACRVKLPAPRTLQVATLLVTVLGGYQNLSRDGPARFQIMWRDLERRSIAAFTYEIMEEA